MIIVRTKRRVNGTLVEETIDNEDGTLTVRRYNENGEVVGEERLAAPPDPEPEVSIEDLRAQVEALAKEIDRLESS